LAVTIYGFRDTSGAGIGIMYAKPNGSIKFCHAVWGKDVETKSSNYREL